LEKNSTKENSELRERVTKVEQKQMQNNNTPNDNVPNDNTSNFNLATDHHGKSSEDEEADDFLNEVHKKRIGDDIR
jgi:hypothetical protein